MSDASRKFFSGKSVEQALLQAASHYGLRPEEVRYREVEKKHGFTRTPKNVVIAVDPEQPRRSPEEMAEAARLRAAPSGGEAKVNRPSPGSREGRPSGRGREERGGGRGGDARGRGGRSGGFGRREGGFRAADVPLVTLPVAPIKRAETMPRAEGAQASSAQRALELLLAFVGVEAEADVFQGVDRLEIELFGPDDRLLLESDGQVLMALEHLVPRMMRGLGAEPIPVRVDCDNFHMIREERLRDLAQRVAAEVRRSGRYQIIDELDPSERRIIHVTLKDDPGVATESLGDGYFKRLKVFLVSARGEDSVSESSE